QTTHGIKGTFSSECFSAGAACSPRIQACVNSCQKVSARKFTPEKVGRKTVSWRNIRKYVRNVIGIVVLRKSIRQKTAGNSLTFTEDKQHHFIIQQENRNPPLNPDKVRTGNIT
ncbi:hypothetical protein, partial [Escherichia coli]|uniref:hypothetical protein n=1 Tax=Escherichia coli TaxID=562 RepID=UPI001BC89CC6